MGEEREEKKKEVIDKTCLAFEIRVVLERERRRTQCFSGARFHILSRIANRTKQSILESESGVLFKIDKRQNERTNVMPD